MQRQDLTGYKIGDIQVLEFGHIYKRHTYWKFRCSCGNEDFADASNIKNGRIKSCGCKQRLKKVKYTDSPLYIVWIDMRGRCNTPTHRAYKWYGGRGIMICERWSDYEKFYEDMNDGYSKGLEIDRIDFNGNYEPSNCRWATRKQQMRNRRGVKLNEEKAAEIRSSNIRTGVLSEMYNVSKNVIRGIRKGTVWA